MEHTYVGVMPHPSFSVSFCDTDKSQSDSPCFGGKMKDLFRGCYKISGMYTKAQCYMLSVIAIGGKRNIFGLSEVIHKENSGECLKKHYFLER